MRRFALSRVVILFAVPTVLLGVTACDLLFQDGSEDDNTETDTAPPAEVADLTAEVADSEVVLSWTDPSDGDLDHIVITWDPTDGMSQPAEAAPGDQSLTVTGLTNGTEYTATVKTVDTTGNTSAGQSVTATPTVSDGGNGDEATPDLGTLFTEVNAGLTDVRDSASALGDLDDDGDLDILITGEDASQLDVTATVYKNEGGFSFSAAGAGLTAVDRGSVTLGDINSDGALDIVITGDDSGNNDVGKVYKNDGSLTFTDLTTWFTGTSSGSTSLGDLGGDAKPDLVVTGYDGEIGGSRIAEAYVNDYDPQGPSVFTSATSASFTAVNQSSSNIADLDGDGDLDVLITGNDGTSQTATIYRNDGSFIFTAITDELGGVDNGSSSVGDLDGDSDLDVVLTGRDTDGNRSATVYENTGNLTFSDAGAGLTSVVNSSSALGDLDGDGDLDILVTGNVDGGLSATIYENEGNLTFSAVDAGLTGVNNGSSNIGDIDGDGDLDILITGSSSTQTEMVYENTLN